MKETKKNLSIYIKENLKLFKEKKSIFGNRSPHGIYDCLKNLFSAEECDYSFDDSYRECKRKSSSIKEFIDEHDQYSNFQTLLFKLIDDRNLRDADVYNKVHIDRRLFSKIRSDKNYHPSKETVILLAIALELSENELDDLLNSASYSLPKNNNYDLIIRFCFINKIFKLSDINELLDEYKCSLFNY